MSEQLLTVDEVALKLKVNRSTVYKNLAALKAKGLTTIALTKKAVRFRKKRLDKAIRSAEERGEALFDMPKKCKQ